MSRLQRESRARQEPYPTVPPLCEGPAFPTVREPAAQPEERAEGEETSHGAPAPATPACGPRPYGRGSQAAALQAASDPRECRRQLLGEASVPNSRRALESRQQLWLRLGRRAGFGDPFQLSPDAVFAIMGALKIAGYRSAELYLESAKAEHVARGHPWTDQLAQARRAARRSCRRYLGNPKQAKGLPLARLGEIRGERPLAVGGPRRPGRATLLASWWLLREIEASNARREHIRVDHSLRQVTWSLPCTKTDQQALGADRTHSCSCEFAPIEVCPYHSMVDHLNGLPEHPSQPVFPTDGNTPATKLGWADTFQCIAAALGLPTVHPNGARAYTGHSARATGAIHLAGTQVELWRIQLFGRWGSEVFLHYLQDAPVAQLDRLAIECSVHTSIRAARAELQQLLAHTRQATALREAVALPSPAMLADCEAAPPDEGPTHAFRNETVRNNEGGKVHQVAARPLDSHPRMWRTRCGWPFAGPRADYEFLPEVPTANLCRRCFPNQRASTQSSTSTSSRASAGGSR